MKKIVTCAALAASLLACQDKETATTDFTGNESVYALAAGSEYVIDGTVTFKERKDGQTMVVIALSGTEGNIEHPVHLHLGNIGAPDADIYALLNPVLGKTGISETLLTQAGDETPLNYAQLTALDACIKIHLAASGPDRDIILAGGNIGAAVADNTSGRLSFGTCKSE